MKKTLPLLALLALTSACTSLIPCPPHIGPPGTARCVAYQKAEHGRRVAASMQALPGMMMQAELNRQYTNQQGYIQAQQRFQARQELQQMIDNAVGNAIWQEQVQRQRCLQYRLPGC